jgi:hypothetical protein
MAELVSASGTPVLATAGSGDVLAGIAVTLLAQTGDSLRSGRCAARFMEERLKSRIPVARFAASPSATSSMPQVTRGGSTPANLLLSVDRDCSCRGAREEALGDFDSGRKWGRGRVRLDSKDGGSVETRCRMREMMPPSGRAAWVDSLPPRIRLWKASTSVAMVVAHHTGRRRRR